MPAKYLFPLLIWSNLFAQTTYELGPNSFEYPGIPKGKVTQYDFQSSIYPNTTRAYFVYVPAQYNDSIPAALMVFQDGHAYLKEDGHFRTATVFDNLIAQQKMPVTIGLFINPGHHLDRPEAENPFRVSNRSIEYDSMSDTYGRFLLEELIPELANNYKISDDPRMRAIAGLSSGGICAFTTAWHFPNQFHKVLSHIGSFTNIRGGHHYPALIRKSPKKDIKVFLQDGSHDLDNRFGNWWLANLQMEAALRFKGYEHKFVAGEGAHDGNHGGAILPQTLEWLWSDQAPDQVEASVYALDGTSDHQIMFAGQTPHFDQMSFEFFKLPGGDHTLTADHEEQLLIIHQGELEVTLGNDKQRIGPTSVFMVSAGDVAKITCHSPVSLHKMSYRSKSIDTDSDDRSFIMDAETLDFRKHSRGGVKSYFNRSTPMCSYYEMHVTTLNPGIKSHDPHTHVASEIILIIEGETEEEIGNEIYQAKAGDVYFLPAHVPHAIKNIGTKPCRYFAFQWY